MREKNRPPKGPDAQRPALSTPPRPPAASRSGPTSMFDQVYETERRLSSGSFGTVYTCRRRRRRRVNGDASPSETKADEGVGDDDDEVYAVKVLHRADLKEEGVDAVQREVSLLRELSDCPTVIDLIDFFVEPSQLYVVLAYAAGGDVFERLTERTVYTEKHARDLARILLETIRDLHSVQPHPIVHRDLKPENLLLKDRRDDTSILLADFGFARHVKPDEMCQTRCGTPVFVAPEILLGVRYSLPVDLWSTGCLLYMLICGYPPFRGDNHRDLFRKVRACDFVFHERYWGNVSVAAKQVISNLLTVNPHSRWSACKALGSAWFKSTSAESLRSTDLSGSLREMKKFREFHPRRAWKGSVKAIQFASTAPFWKPDAAAFANLQNEWDGLHGRDTGALAAIVDGAVKKAAADKQHRASGRTATAAGVRLSDPMACSPAVRAALMTRIPKLKFADVYELKTKLRKGTYASVWECTHRATHDPYACKIINRSGLKQEDDEAVLNEVAIMQSLTGNKYMVQIMDFYEEDDYFYIVMELALGGDVFDRIVARTAYTERDARDLAVHLLKAVKSMHDLKIAHRDIKPQNLLLVDAKDDACIKVADFGFARRVHCPCSLIQRVGTPTYVAPEILKNVPHDERCDLWSVGVVVFVLLVGYPPFQEDRQSELFRRIRSCDWSFVEQDWRHISDDAKHLIRGLLVADPKDRWSVQEALRCSWIRQDPDQLSRVSLSSSLAVLKKRKNKLRTLARAMMWAERNGESTVVLECTTQAQDEVVEVVITDKKDDNIVVEENENKDKVSGSMNMLSSLGTCCSSASSTSRAAATAQEIAEEVYRKMKGAIS